MTGCCIDIIIVEGSMLVKEIAGGKYPAACEYCIAGELHKKPFWFADGIYRKAPIIVLTIMSCRT